MRVVRDLADMDAVRDPLCMAAGFFDGLHRGHQRVIASASTAARRGGAQVWLMTFDPHPAQVLRPDTAPPLLTALRQKLRMLEDMALDGCLLVPFTHRLSQLLPEEFLDLLCSHVRTLRSVYVGPNWTFGRDRRGNAEVLRRLLAPRGIHAETVVGVDLDGSPISSTRVRCAVVSGELTEAQALLGRPFSVLGTVVPGRGVGRALGFPTANIACELQVRPPDGVYAARARLGARLLDGVLNLGRRPTLGENSDSTLEIHLFDTHEDLYGLEVEVFFVERIRDERHFAGRDALVAQIQRDAKQARDILLRQST